jgi:hypothetical protein
MGVETSMEAEVKHENSETDKLFEYTALLCVLKFIGRLNTEELGCDEKLAMRNLGIHENYGLFKY